ncbi:MAG: nucleotidyltransferase family protein [Armatimonadetes bacterium]|nr:nucleotidyltransferase family protein [Armatimonadota bacterium]
MDRIDAIILAGAPAGPDLNPSGGLKSRAMIRLGDKTMLQWVVDALRGSQSVGRIVAVGDVDAEGLDMVIEAGPDLVSNIKLGIDALGANGRVLIVSSDIPLLTPEAVEDFIERAEKADVDLAYPIIPRTHCEKRYPGLARTYLRTGDGVFTGGNLMLVSPDFIAQHWDAIADAYAARKHVFKLARMIGVGVLVRVMVGQALPPVLSVATLERAVSRMLGAKVSAVVSAHPEIGEDVDKPSDVEAVRKYLSPSGSAEGRMQNDE